MFEAFKQTLIGLTDQTLANVILFAQANPSVFVSGLLMAVLFFAYMVTE